MDMKRAGDLMVPLDQYPHLPYWFTLRQAIAEMDKSEIDVRGRRSQPRVVLVFNEKYQLLGMARRRDILRGLEPKFMIANALDYREKLFDVQVDPNLSEMSYEKLLEGFRQRAERPVSEVMQPIAATVLQDDHIAKIVNEMVSHNTSLLPVLSDQRVVGVVRSVDVLHELAQFLL